MPLSRGFTLGVHSSPLQGLFEKHDKNIFNMIGKILQRHLQFSFRMLLDVVEKCPDELWIRGEENDSVWKRVFHVLESLDFWFDDFSGYLFPGFFKGFSAEMDVDNKTSLTKQQIRHYGDLVKKKIDVFFTVMNPLKLEEKSNTHPNVTYADIVLSQIRHLQINVGYCNEKFIGKKLKGVTWAGYNE
jgi:hypothetical protein